ncbi:hypothetical protein NX059_000151 [Plenodomus lindquistii]|nr:hypothetical protein NX059_000151 [Plenodomus lindquistii]
MAKRKTAPTDASSMAKKVKPSKAAPVAKAAKRATNKPSTTKAAIDLNPIEAVETQIASDTATALAKDAFVVKEATVVAERNVCTTVFTDDSLTSINDEDEYDLYIDENDGIEETFIASEDDKLEATETTISFDESGKIVDVVTGKATDEEEFIEAGLNNKWMAEYARQALISGLHTQLTLAPAILSTAGANTIGDTIDLSFTVNGLKIEVLLKIVGVEEPVTQDVSEDANDDAIFEPILEPTLIGTTDQSDGLSIDTQTAQSTFQTAAPLSTNAPLSNSRANIPCKFADSCSKGDSCPFDHTIVTKKKLCTWVNTINGCAKGDNCHFSHDHEGKMCSKSTLRTKCENGAVCAFKHKDDGPKNPSSLKENEILPNHRSKSSDLKYGSVTSSTQGSCQELPSPALRREYQDEDHHAITGINIPTGPKNLGKGASRKRHTESEKDGYDAPRPYKHNNHHHHQSQEQADGTPTGSRNASGGRKSAQGRGGGNGGRGKTRSRGGK